MRRLLIIRKDLHLSAGKLAAQVGHCCEAYWTNLMKHSAVVDNEFDEYDAVDPWHPDQPAMYHSNRLNREAEAAFKRGETKFFVPKVASRPTVTVHLEITKHIWNDYVNDIFTKTICEARNRNHLLKAETIAKELGLKDGEDYGFINDKCLTELEAENEDDTTTVGMWFRPLADEIAHKISKKFPLLKDHADFVIPLRNREWTINWHKCGDGKSYTFKTCRPTEIDAFNALLQSEPGMCAGDIIVDSLYS